MRSILCTALTVALTTSVVAAGERPSPVSPGRFDAAELAASSCPTFSWTHVADALGYELAVYRIEEEGTLRVALERTIAGAASSWTPSIRQCPAAGSRFAWSVRALTTDGAGAWSEAMLFETAGTPSAAEVQTALEVLQRHQRASTAVGVVPEAAMKAHHAEPGTASSPANRRNPVPTLGALVADTVSAAPPAPTIIPPSSFSLSLEDDLKLGGYVFKGDDPFIHVAYGNGSTGNTAVGLRALESITASGTKNTALGFEALQSNNLGGRNTAVGYRALRNNTRHFNTAVGTRALETSAQGRYNTAVGAFALLYNQDTYDNTALGNRAMQNNTTGQYNTATGAGSLYDNVDGDRNTATGYRALENNTSGDLNIAVGVFALRRNTTGSSNAAAGYRALDNNLDGTYNAAFGYRAMDSNAAGTFNTAIGPNAGEAWTNGHNNIAVGVGSDGVVNESATIRIGGADKQTATFIEGINGFDASSGDAVCILATDQLGTCSVARDPSAASSSGELAVLRQQVADLNRIVADLRRRLEATQEE